MKRISILTILLLFTLGAMAQGTYTPRVTWPFIYQDFLDGATRTRDGGLITEAKFNIAVHDGSLMYVGEDEVIMKPDMTKVYTARIGKDDVYVNVLGRMYKVLSELDCGSVLLGTEVDQEKMNKVNIGYGISSSTASTQGISLVMDGSFESNIHNLMKEREDKYRGDPLPVKQVYYLYDGTRLIPASKQEILNTPGIDKKTANSFFKQEKIKWKETASLEKLLIFVVSQLN